MIMIINNIWSKGSNVYNYACISSFWFICSSTYYVLCDTLFNEFCTITWVL